MVFNLTRGPIQNLNLCEIAQNRYNDAGNGNGSEFILNTYSLICIAFNAFVDRLVDMKNVVLQT